LLTLFHPADGHVCVKGVTRTPNAVLHPWLKEQLTRILDSLPPPMVLETPAGAEQCAAATAALWRHWQQNLSRPITLPQQLPPLRMLLIFDNLVGHHTPAFVLWLFAHGIMPLYTPLGGSWLNMAESMQRILVRRALDAQSPQTTQQIIDALEATAHSWNQQPTPFTWDGKRAARRLRARQRKLALGGSGACVSRPPRRRKSLLNLCQLPCQPTH
jgi:hypothetical protein